jgi:hypothetical protein
LRAGGDLDEIKASLASLLNGVACVHDAECAAVIKHDPH